MKHIALLFSLSCWTAAAALGAEAAPAGPSPAEIKLREALRNTMLQLKAAQDEAAALQAKVAQSESEKTAAQEQVAALTGKLGEMAKKGAAEKEAADKAQAALQAQITGRDGQIQQLNAALAKWKEGYNLAVAALEATEKAKALAVEERLVTQRKLEMRELQNLELYKLADEILTRYKKFSLGDALAAKEPFTGITRSRLEGLVQEYREKLQEHKPKPEENIPATAARAPAPAPGLAAAP